MDNPLFFSKLKKGSIVRVIIKTPSYVYVIIVKCCHKDSQLKFCRFLDVANNCGKDPRIVPILHRGYCYWDLIGMIPEKDSCIGKLRPEDTTIDIIDGKELARYYLFGNIHEKRFNQLKRRAHA